MCDAPARLSRCSAPKTNALCGRSDTTTEPAGTDHAATWPLCSQTIRVVDHEPPVLVGIPGNALYSCFDDLPSPPAVTALDLCDSDVRVFLCGHDQWKCPGSSPMLDGYRRLQQLGAAMPNLIISPPPPVVSGLSDQVVCPGKPVTFCAVDFQRVSGHPTNGPRTDAIPGATGSCTRSRSQPQRRRGVLCASSTTCATSPELRTLHVLTNLTSACRASASSRPGCPPLPRDCRQRPGPVEYLSKKIGGVFVPIAMPPAPGCCLMIRNPSAADAVNT